MRLQAREDVGRDRRTADVSVRMLFIAIAGAFLSSPTAGQSAARDFANGPERRHEAALTIDGHGVADVHVRLARGTLIARGSDSTDIHLRAIQRSSSVDPRVVVMRTSHVDGVLRIAAQHPPCHEEPTRECLFVDEELGDFWHYNVAVDVELSVPRRMRLKMFTMRGDIEVSDVTAGFEVATNDGDVRVRGAPTDFKAVALGNVDVELDSQGWANTGSRLASSYGGDVRLWVPRYESLRIGSARKLVAQTHELELGKAEGSEDLSVPVVIGGASAPIQVEVRRGRLMLMLASSPVVRRR